MGLGDIYFFLPMPFAIFLPPIPPGPWGLPTAPLLSEYMSPLKLVFFWPVGWGATGSVLAMFSFSLQSETPAYFLPAFFLLFSFFISSFFDSFFMR